MFNYLDKDKDGFLTYHEFSDLSEEKRREIDPFDRIVQKVREKQEERNSIVGIYDEYQNKEENSLEVSRNLKRNFFTLSGARSVSSKNHTYQPYTVLNKT